ncbi:hypothetical protein [Streptomyces sp. CB02923]|uniref:hypothetical protein n=1 Tax=Streptomyces sp. CB02923 TaxID=1718985 RepID=UPI0018FF4117|nr:hypothetical protein [Streptomyces sp. CB02923]
MGMIYVTASRKGWLRHIGAAATVMGACGAVLVAPASPADAAVAACTVNGVPMNATVVSGTAGSDVISCGRIPAGVTVNGLGGNDEITARPQSCGDANAGSINGGPGNDRILVSAACGGDGNNGLINAGEGDDSVTARGGDGAYAITKSGGDGNNATIEGGGGRDDITVRGGNGAEGGRNDGIDGGAGGYGNDGTVTAAGTITAYGGAGGPGRAVFNPTTNDADGGRGGDGNNRTIRFRAGEGNLLRLFGGNGGYADPASAGEGGRGGDGNDASITVFANVQSTGGNGGNAGANGSDGGDGGDGTNRSIRVTGIYAAGGNTLTGGNGGVGRPCGRAGEGNDSTVTGAFSIRNGTSC